MSVITSDIKLKNQIIKFVEDKVYELAETEIEKARERLKDKIPELAAEIGIKLQQVINNPYDFTSALQIVLYPRIK